MTHMSSRWGIGAAAFLSGVALGIAGALLWAPQSGKRTREDLQDFATDAFEQAEDWMETAKEKMDDLLEKGKMTVKAG
ncbi:MAG: YtxH domain-containing protein [Nitrospira sp.]|nr:YtxH domain-containing protein [Nitrospira sp.]MCB9711242.1 YtxH domain-containing protein [Nitrospiraceae bacterium]MDR4486752.1 YtxH domain-containing protein [Nitrospirales bacterium]MCA9467378.1 YtxH domain-containing protein [Nitrospira sp.]MCA9474533.1 YtxH domain-containing protein [Nitrospira sp.]